MSALEETSANALVAIDTALSVEAELARLEELEHELTRMKVRCDSDSLHSCSASTVSTRSGGSAVSSPLNETSTATSSTPPTPPRTPKRRSRSIASQDSCQDDEEKRVAPSESPSAVAAAQRFGVARPVVGVRRIASSNDLPGRLRTDLSSPTESSSKLKKLSSAETRRAYALSVKARMMGNGNVDDSIAVRKPLLRKRSSGSSHGSDTGSVRSSSASALLPPTPLELITPTVFATPNRRRDSIGSTTSSVSSISSSPSTTSSISNISARSARYAPATTATSSSSRLQRTRSTTSMPTAPQSAPSAPSSSASRVSPAKLSTGVPPPKVSVMQRLLQASNGDAKDARVDSELVKQLKQQYVLAEQGVQQLLKPPAGTMPPSPMRGAETEVRRLKGGMKTLNEHSVALMLACEVLQRQQDAQQDEISQMRVVNDQLMREMEVLAASSKNSSGFSTPVSRDGTAAEAMEEDASQDESEHVSTGGRRFSADSSLSAFVNEMLRKATEKIEEKWKARFAEKQAEHEWALAVERDRASASVVSNSRLVTETKHEKEDEMKALREDNVAIKLENKQMAIEMTALNADLEYLRSQLSQQDEIRNSSSFWEKTTDLAKQNRALTEDLALTQQTVKKLEEVIKDLRTQNHEFRAENEACVRRTKELEVEKQVLQDRLVQVESKFDDEKTRREQFHVNVEQLTVENTALYAQMVALQATHEAKMEELRASFEKRNVILAGEMRALQAQNNLMRRMDHPGPIVVGSRASSPSSTSTVALSAEAERELDARLQQVTDELLSVRQELVLRTDQIAELERSVAESEIVRRKLHNTIQELRGNIRVHVRLRPFLRSDGDEARAENPRSAIRSDSFGGTISTNVEKPHTFAFDKVYGQSESQEAVFSDVADFIQSAMDGYNVCIFAYGQTGSGKTHTMQGSGKAQMRGIIPRALQLIITSCRELSTQGWQYALEVTFYEIYNETIRDLLSSGAGNGTTDKYNIRTDRRGKNYVEGLITVPIDFDVAEDQLEEIVNVAACNRSVDKTDMNAHSSRSHSIFGLKIRGVNEAQNTELEGSLSLVDLAGSERLSRSNATGDRLKEAQAINKSLSAMADVFQALAKKSAHVPYRNSKLTYVLQPALSGDGKTLMMVNLSPTYQSVDESVCSLRFAQNVSQCELGAPTRQIKARDATGAASGSGNGSTVASTAVRSSPARALTGSTSAVVNATSSATSTPTRQRSMTAATPPVTKKLQF